MQIPPAPTAARLGISPLEKNPEVPRGDREYQTCPRVSGYCCVGVLTFGIGPMTILHFSGGWFMSYDQYHRADHPGIEATTARTRQRALEHHRTQACQFEPRFSDLRRCMYTGPTSDLNNRTVRGLLTNLVTPMSLSRHRFPDIVFDTAS